MAHIQTDITGVTKMLPLVFNAPDIIPVGLIGPVGVGKTHYFKGLFRDLYAEHVGVSADQMGFIQEAWRIATLLKLLASHCHQKMPTATSSRNSPSHRSSPRSSRLVSTTASFCLMSYCRLALTFRRCLLTCSIPQSARWQAGLSPTAGSFASPATVLLTSQALPVCSRTCSIVRPCLS